MKSKEKSVSFFARNVRQAFGRPSYGLFAEFLPQISGKNKTLLIDLVWNKQQNFKTKRI